MTQFPVGLLVERHGPWAEAPELVAGMRCERCGAPPASADWTDDPQGSAHGSTYSPRRRKPVVRLGG